MNLTLNVDFDGVSPLQSGGSLVTVSKPMVSESWSDELFKACVDGTLQSYCTIENVYICRSSPKL